MDSFLKQFIAYLKFERNLSENSIEAYNTDLNRYVSYLKSKGVDKPEKVNEQAINLLLQSLSQLGLAPASISRNLSSIKSFQSFWSEKVFLKSILLKTLKDQN